MRNHHRPRFVSCLCLILLSLAFCTPCLRTRAAYEPNEWWTVDGDAEPSALTQGSLLWLPRKMTDGKWRYFPQPLCGLIDRGGAAEIEHCSEVTLIVDGRRWVMIPKNSGWAFIPPWEKLPEDLDKELAAARLEESEQGRHGAQALAFFLVCITAVVGIIAAGIAYGAGADAGEANSQAKLSEKLTEREQGVLGRENEVRQAHAANARWREGEQAQLNRERDKLKARELELGEQRQRELLALRNAETMLRTPTAAATPKAISVYLRKRHVQGAALGDLIAATFLADRTGFIRLAWTVQIDRPQPPLLQVLRDGKLIRTDTSLAGEHGDHVVPGHRYLYAFCLKDDQGRVIGQGVQFEVKIPTARVWDSAPEGDENERQKQIREKFKSRYDGFRVIEELRQECYADVKARGYPKDLEEWLLSKIDALAAELSG
jgi:hypothetical protein